ncbi:hypothetical protein I5J36_gp52 [Mycobacterium phage Mendokysei]|uniref:Uncharacterized protein n=1 Tax=Mycobacterium phage Mendokysei TaxID=2099637 RepID=A0A2P1CGE1_9CAUD|nr:hypothetical protein I5J36_gp52 [Mycobacterium phage Mendokysei]AVJ50268.1 hypothetical protein SEA_MENDOKYSEI_52 [Mycobacterium phage Mendokysei]
MNVRIRVLGVELASIEVDFDDDGGQAADVAVKLTPLDRMSDYCTRRFIKRKLLP